MAIIKTKFDRGVEGATNIVDGGTEGTKVASGTTAQRGSTAGQFRFNSTTGKFEGRNASNFVSIEVSPSVTSVNNNNITQAQIDANFDLVITGSNFGTGDTVEFIANDNTVYTSPTVTVNSATQITARVNTNIDASKEPFSVKISNTGGLSGQLNNAFNINASPVFTTASGSLGTIMEDVAVTATLNAGATDPEGSSVTHSISSGSLPTGLSIASATGLITGTPNVNDTYASGGVTHNFTVSATDGTNTSTRAFSILRQFADGSTLAKANTSAKNIYNLGASFQGASASGLYYLDPDGTGTYAGQYYCRMDYGGGWVLAMQLVREQTGNGTFPLATTSARGTMSTNPYSVPTGQTKIHNTAMSALETQDSNYKYDLMLHYWTYNSSSTADAQNGAQYPTAGTTVATTTNGVPSDSSPYVGRNFYFKSTKSLSGACASGTSDTNSIFGNTVSDYTNIYQNMSSSTINDFRSRNPITDTTSSTHNNNSSSIYNFHRNAGGVTTELAYSNRCNDGYTGSYIIDRDFNCYHNYVIWYVR